jgi:DNA (cytosine-5)-methyltransferase 1
LFEPIVYGICSDSANSMKSDNPHSGIYVADTTRTLDQNGGNPACNQGGMAIVQSTICLQGSMIGRADKNGPQGNGINEDVCFTLNTTDRHAILDMSHACDVIRDCGQIVPALQHRMGTGGNQVPLVMNKGFRMTAFGEYADDDTALAMKARDYKDATDLVTSKMRVRRLTPLECERLQGYPDGWTDIPKASDSGRYKACGNSVAIPCVEYVMEGIAEVFNA